MIWRCFICYIFVALTLKKLLSHVNTMHSRSPDFHVVCGIDGCPNEYRVYNSYYYHIKRTHAHHLLQVEGAEEEGSTHHGSPGTGERATNTQTNVNSPAAEMVCATQEHSSGIEEASIVTRTVRYYFWHSVRQPGLKSRGRWIFPEFTIGTLAPFGTTVAVFFSATVCKQLNWSILLCIEIGISRLPNCSIRG